MDRKPSTLVTMRISASQLARLETRCDVKQAGWGLTGIRLSEDELIQALDGVEILMAGYEKITAGVIQQAPVLKLIAIARGNPANLDYQAASKKDIPVLYAPGRNAIAAAEFTMGVILSQARHIAKSDRTLRSGIYTGKPMQNFTDASQDQDVIWDLDGDNPYTAFCGVELHGKCLGLIGLGQVASRVASLAGAFGMQVYAYSPKSNPEFAKSLNVELVDEETLLRNSDFISVHCRVTAETRGMLDAHAFSLMKPTCHLINTARAIIIDQAALMNALKDYQIAGAALDVYWYEPLPSNHPLLALENLTVTPHLAGATMEVIERHSRMLVDDVFAWLDGQTPAHIFSP